MNDPIPFEEFMRRALHDPAGGYYSRNIHGIGRRGDFTTAPMLSEAPARAIAAWAARAMRESSCRNLIEIGPGQGQLAAAVCKHLPWQLRWKTRLHLVETSEPLIHAQRKHLGNKPIWHPSPAAALAACRGNAVIYSNELVDAFPVRRFQNTDSGWRELAVAFEAGGTAVESLLPPAPLPDSSGFSSHHQPGQWIEVHESYQHWLAAWLPLWKSGRMLTIDYGSTAESIYHRRPHGTIRGYLHHQVLAGTAIYQNPGRVDLTADVNFTDLMRWSHPWTTRQHVRTLASFLAESPDALASATSPLSDPQGAGGAFLVLDETARGG